MTTIKQIDVQAIKALYEYMEENAEVMNLSTWEKITAHIDQCWSLLERRGKR